MNKHRLALGMIGVGLFVTGVGIGAFIIDNKKGVC